jgi:hypothetical protein
MNWKIIGSTIDELTHSETLVYECSNCKSRTIIPSPQCFFCKEVSEKAKEEFHRDEAQVGWL